MSLFWTLVLGIIDREIYTRTVPFHLVLIHLLTAGFSLREFVSFLFSLQGFDLWFFSLQKPYETEISLFLASKICIFLSDYCENKGFLIVVVFWRWDKVSWEILRRSAVIVEKISILYFSLVLEETICVTFVAILGLYSATKRISNLLDAQGGM